MTDRLTDSVIVVTGAGSGIGRASAVRLAQEGARVVVADLRGQLAQETVALIEAEQAEKGGAALAVECDVAEEAQVAAMTEAALARFGRLTGLYANAGTAGAGWIHETRLEDWQRVIDVNLTGAFLCVKHVLPHLLERGGVVLTTGSIASVVVGGGGSAASYAASKGGILQLTKQIAVDYGGYGIRAVCVCPGPIKTNLGAHAREDGIASVSPVSPGDSAQTAERLPRSPFRIPANRAAEASEVASTVAFLFSDDASFITGSAVFVDGGLTAI